MIHFTVTTAPPVSDYGKRGQVHLRVSHDTEDDLIERLITAAREWCEAYQNPMLYHPDIDGLLVRALPSGHWTCQGDLSSLLPLIVYVDTDGDSQTMDVRIIALILGERYA